MNKAQKPVLWHHGLFLRPHHFQYNDAYLKSLSTPHNLYHSPYFWGCGALDVQEAALLRRVIEFDNCELIFQDGTWVKVPENAVVIPRSFEDISFDTEGQAPVTVYLGMKKADGRAKNVTSVKNGMDLVPTRYACPVEPDEILDTHEGGEPAQIRKLTHVLKIFWETEIDRQVDYLLMPVCRLELSGEAVVMSRQYIRPCFSLESSPLLMQMLKSLRENMISRCRVFESYKFSQGLSSSDFDAHFLPHLLVLNSLNRSLPVLNHMIELATFHPHAVYLALGQIIGDLSTFTDRINALGQSKDGQNFLPEYDHQDLFSCFNQAQLLVGELLKGISIGGESIITMARNGSYFSARIPAEEFRDGYMYFIVIKSKTPADQIVNDLQHIAKIGPAQAMENMISRALPGLGVRHRMVPPPGMPKREDTFFFRIDTKHYLWEDIQRAGDITLFWNDAPEDLCVELVISQL